ncbi:beta-fructofuranosidase insoluble isoenzyme 1-like [Prunus yedoensis var. nudiflora]|uniref:Beta-fructofuranosidase insoluble isoenzyme 1-like n=1 Tax=Prunus yedoensis var. nudiflora TaxID=2094558 RepID=A0A314ZGV7_PRUYE|nr:beta-fructofuranosidase insoluble isoenzyme 1-like [Prunus yedoensis var. nudiflora]
MFFNGLYHLFYQYNPKGSVWGNIVWAHSISKDLINWDALPHAIFPSKPFDVNGTWSGSATILPGNRPVILYTASTTTSDRSKTTPFRPTYPTPTSGNGSSRTTTPSSSPAQT